MDTAVMGTPVSGAARNVELEIVHTTAYRYAAPVSLAHHLAHLQPVADEHQQVLAFEFDVQPPPSRQRHSMDAFGNACCHFTHAQPHRELSVRSCSRVRVAPRFATFDAAQSPAWETVRDRLRYVARAPFDAAVEYVQPSPYVPRLEALRAYAALSFPPARPLAEGARELMQRIHADFTYGTESTEVDTPLAQAFEQRSGVCQDFAHVMAGALRMLGLPARYVSGYLLTHAAQGGHALVGADASHAWVQVYCPLTSGVPGVPGSASMNTSTGAWLDLDPTNDIVPSTDHVRLAVGRDYGDVAPLRGVIRGGGPHVLTVGVRTRVLEAAPEARLEPPLESAR